jgi:type IV fimbrial biogenesis protein FimT
MKQHGFTLIELTIVLTIVSLIFSFANPSYRFIINQLRAKSDINNLLTMLRTTREYAIINAATTVLCPTNDERICVRNWKLPTIQFIDRNNNKQRDPDESIQKRFKALGEDDVFIKYPKTQVRFNKSGMASFYNGTFGYCLGDTIKGIIISRIGRIRFAQDLNGDNIPDINLNTVVACR